MSQSGTVAGTVLRISVVSDDRRLDVGVPSQVPLVEIIPGFARSLGVLDPTLTHGGYALQRVSAVREGRVEHAETAGEAGDDLDQGDLRRHPHVEPAVVADHGDPQHGSCHGAALAHIGGVPPRV